VIGDAEWLIREQTSRRASGSMRDITCYVVVGAARYCGLLCLASLPGWIALLKCNGI
jgi:hypothetical protein